MVGFRGVETFLSSPLSYKLNSLNLSHISVTTLRQIFTSQSLVEDFNVCRL